MRHHIPDEAAIMVPADEDMRPQLRTAAPGMDEKL
jgi:hypothetical protein